MPVPSETEKFAALFRNPTPESMYQLTPREFEHFVAYVLRRAGYDAKVVGPHFLHGVDIEMRVPGKESIVGGVECKRYTPDKQFVTAAIVQHVKGASAVQEPDAKPFVVTTSDFNANAHKMALEGTKHTYLVSGAQLVRYIKYVEGSRYDGDDPSTLISPEFFSGRESVVPSDVKPATVLTIANNKGGVGKTTTAYYLGAELARQGYRVLLVDLDGQGNLTERCLPKLVDKYNSADEHFMTIAQYFAGERTLIELILSSETQSGMSIIPSDPFLTLRDYGGSGRPDIELRFVRDIERLRVSPIASLGGVPNWIIMDTPPAMSVFSRAGLAASQYTLAPVRPRRASLAGTRNMLKTVRTMNQLMGTSSTFLGAVVTHWDDLELSKDFLRISLIPAITGAGGQIFGRMIPIDNRLDNVGPDAHTKGVEEYRALTNDILQIIPRGPSNGESHQFESTGQAPE